MIQTAHARAVMTALARSGVDLVIVSPGSRSTPLVAAALAIELPLRVIVDERAAAHAALGRARVTGRATALLCTSGSAAANYLPAVVEASAARLPLVLLTADRPPELHGCEAPQTMNQQRLYGEHARLFVDLGRPTDRPQALPAVARAVARAVAASLAPEPGPVQINVPLAKPLEPVEPTGAWAEAVAALTVPRAEAPPAGIDDGAVRAIADACASATRGVITCGPMPLAAAGNRTAIEALARATGFPILAEATSQQRFGGATELVVGSFDLLWSTSLADRAVPDLVLQLGAPPVSAAWARFLATARPRRIAIAEHGWPDPQGDAAMIVNAPVGALAARIADALPERDATDFTAALLAADRTARRRIDDALAGGPLMNELAAVRAAVAGFPDGGLLAVGNSNPVRAIDLAVAPGAFTGGVLHQRGVSGIDGVIAGAVGAATATDRPILLVVGDVSFAHDVGALAAARDLAAPLCVCVIDNRGGRIFERLPVAGNRVLAGDFERLWLTPPPVDIAGAARAFGVACSVADTPDAVRRAVASAVDRPACTVVRAVVDPGSAEETRRALVAGLSGELAEVLA